MRVCCRCERVNRSLVLGDGINLPVTRNCAISGSLDLGIGFEP